MIVLTSDLRKCPEGHQFDIVNKINLSEYNGNSQVGAIICSRDIAHLCETLDFPNLKLIQLFSAGFEGINLDYLKEKGIHLCNAANVYNVGMAEFVVFAVLMSAKRYNKSIKNRRIRLLRNYKYITELAGKTAGILGTGNIGSEIAKRLASFDMHVIGYDISSKPKDHFECIYTLEHLKEFLGEVDYLINCLPLNKATEELINKEWFSLMKNNVTIVNVGRRKIFSEKELYSFLKKHKEASAILDIFEKIPNPISNPFRKLSNVIVLPGVTAISQEINFKLKTLIGENLNRLYTDSPLLNQIV